MQRLRKFLSTLFCKHDYAVIGESNGSAPIYMASGVGYVHMHSVTMCAAFEAGAQAIRDQEAAKHKAEVAELERQVAGLRDVIKKLGDHSANTGQARCMFYAAMLYNKADELEGKK